MSRIEFQRAGVLGLAAWLAIACLSAAHGVRAQEATPPPSAATEPEQAEPIPALAAPPALVPEPPTTGTIETEPPQPVTAQTPPSEPPPSAMDWAKHVKIGGGGVLWYYQPLQKHAKNKLEFFNVRLDADVTVGDFGFHLEPRFRDSKLRSFYDGPVWIEEAYGSFKPGQYLTVKVGKTYSRLGLFWDNSFYGNVQVYDGLKLSADYGVSAEGTVGERIGLNYWAQFFLMDGQTNVSQPGRDTFSIPGAHRRNEGVLNLEPFFKLGSQGLLKVGLSGQVLRADIPGAADTVLRGAIHAKFTWAGFGAWGELLHQKGKSVNAFPIAAVPATDSAGATAGRASGKNDYFLLGAEYTLGRLTLRYNVSYGGYHDVNVHEWMHVPSFTVKIAEPLSVLTELALWNSYAPSGSTRIDRSLNVLLLANF